MNFVIRTPELHDETAIKEYINSMTTEPFGSPGDCGFLSYDTYREWLDTMKRSERAALYSWCYARAKEFIVIDTDTNKVAGIMNLRLEMNSILERNGGHISLSVARQYRRIGLAKSMIEYAKEIYRGIGVYEIILLCSKDNKASKNLIESMNGEFVDEITTTDKLLRYTMIV